MCGRFKLTTPPDALEALFEIRCTLNLAPRYNIAPTQEAPVIGLGQEGRRELRLFRWGLVPAWAKDTKMAGSMINARSETVHEKPAFRQAFAKRRCLIPVDGFYEWQKPGEQEAERLGKIPVLLTLPNQQCFAFAGLWEGWKNPDGTILRSFTIITTTAIPDLQQLHHRMPVILPPQAYTAWLDPSTSEAFLRDLLQPYEVQPITQTPVGNAVSSVRNDDARCVEPRPLIPTELALDWPEQRAGR
ncbi:SOS response-associated peptidase [Dongia soli]|uniref:Abasic site processing protein n=1 Tax=Dongia soli TaxID=600628 RepID=A0ABU5ECE8_9PROT|nr:SOS response-associated peptidase [Dongia soli]MDY0883856.1 SOS response-associated peptidase [Dongia soli]